MNNLFAFALGDAWQNPAGHVHSRNCTCRKNDPFRNDAQRMKSELIESHQLVSRLMNALEINPLYFGPDDPAQEERSIERIIIV